LLRLSVTVGHVANKHPSLQCVHLLGHGEQVARAEAGGAVALRWLEVAIPEQRNGGGRSWKSTVSSRRVHGLGGGRVRPLRRQKQRDSPAPRVLAGSAEWEGGKVCRKTWIADALCEASPVLRRIPGLGGGFAPGLEEVNYAARPFVLLLCQMSSQG